MITKFVNALHILVRAFTVVWIILIGGLIFYIFRTEPIPRLVSAVVTIALLMWALRPKKAAQESRPKYPKTAKREELLAKLSPAQRKAFQEAEAWTAEYKARKNDPHRAKQKPAWALILQSPFEQNPNATSWLGGLPVAPSTFEWPRDKDGKHMSFIAQIDLAEVKRELTTGLRPEGLPESGALLAFLSERCYLLHVVGADDMVGAKEMTAPADLDQVWELGFWINKQLFPKWPINMVPFIDDGNGRPAEFPDRFQKAEEWITNWGIATLEAESMIKNLERDFGFAAEFLEKYGQKPLDADSNGIRRNREYHKPIARHAPALIERMKAWHTLAQSNAPESSIDPKALQAIMKERMFMHEQIKDSSLQIKLAGNIEEIWQNLLWAAEKDTPLDQTPSFLHPLIKARTTDWRGHRLMGLEPEFPNNSEDLRGIDCVLSIHSDDLVETQTEHNYGFSMWCKREDIAQGKFNGGQLIWHSAV